jgi:hypothetical protein
MNAVTTLHQVGAVAERTGLSFRTIRHYDEVGLVEPSGRSSGHQQLDCAAAFTVTLREEVGPVASVEHAAGPTR